MALPQTRNAPTPSPATAAVGRAPATSGEQNRPTARAVKPPKPPGNYFAAQTPPPPKGIGAANIALLIAANIRLREAIKAELATLPECASACLAGSEALSRALVLQSKAASDYATAVERDLPQLKQFALDQAKRAETRDPSAGPYAGDAVRAVQTRADEIVNEQLAVTVKRYEETLAKRATGIGADVVAKLNAARLAVERAELRATLDDATPDPKLTASILRSTEGLPTLRRPAHARLLIERAAKVDDQPLLLALECLLPSMQDLVEHHLRGLTKNVGNYQTGQPSEAMANAVWVVTTLRTLRSARLEQSAVGKAREILAALEFLALKSVGTDFSDPAVVANLSGVFSPARAQSVANAQLKIDAGKTGARWAGRYIRSTAPLRWPSILEPVPMANMQKDPPVERKPHRKGNPAPLKPATLPATLGTPTKA